MGNCCRRDSAMVWASVDDCWEDEAAPPRKDPAVEAESPAGNVSRAPDAPTPLMEHVKIKITKEELEKLVASARLQDVPVDRVLSRLISAVDFSRDQRQRSWSPSLRSIAE